MTAPAARYMLGKETIFPGGRVGGSGTADTFEADDRRARDARGPRRGGPRERVTPPPDDSADGYASVLVLAACGIRLDDVGRAFAQRRLVPFVVRDSEQAVRLVARATLHAAVLDAHAPRWEAVASCARRRGIPTVLVGDSTQLAPGNRAPGVDAYVLGPVDAHAVAAAVQCAVEASGRGARGAIEIGALRVDPVAQVAYVGDRRVELPRKEFELLHALARSAGRPVPAEELLAQLWPDDAGMTRRDLHWHVWRLRTLLGDRDREPPAVANRRGYGYMLDYEGCERLA